MKMDAFRRLPLLGILRGVTAQDVAPLCEAVTAAGLEAIEITMNTAAAPALIRDLVAAAQGRLMVGAGTVLTSADLARAVDAGASFIVMPVLIPEIVEQCIAARIPVFPGALTPLEIWRAWSGGATMVKVFPAGILGPGYLKEVKGPFGDVELLACGGVSAENMAAYFANGASAVAFGASVFRADWLAERQYDRIGASVAVLVQACRAALPIKSSAGAATR